MSLILYLAQVTCCLAIFYVFYYLTLRKETLFETNRFYLVITLASSIALPLIKIYIDSRESDPGILLAPYVYVGSYVETFSTGMSISQESPFPWDKLISGIYFLGVAVLAIRLLNAVKEIQWIRKEGLHTMIDGQRCVLSSKVKSPFSFFKTIYFPKQHQFDETELKEIVAHELAHVKGRHTMDVLFMEVACILFWPSPVIYLYRKALRDVHEFVADAAVIRDTPWEHYAELLVGQQQGQLQNILSNQLIYSQLKKRLLMMNQERSGFAARFKYLGIIPVVLIALVLFSFREKQTDAMNINSVLSSENMNEDVILYVTNSQRYFLGSKEITREEIKSELSKVMMGKGDRILKLLMDQSVKVSELSEVLDVAYKLQINVTLDTAEVYDLYKSGLKIYKSLSPNNASGAPWMYAPEDIYIPQHKLDTLSETTVIAYRTSSLLTVASSRLEGDDRETPLFPGCINIKADEQAQCGMDKLWEYINSNLAYPESLKKADVEGMVVVKFTVGADGLVKNVSISKSLHPDADEEVMRIVMEMNAKVGQWQPALKEGKAIDAELCLPVKFALDHSSTKEDVLMYAEELPRFPGCEHIADVQERSACATQKLYEFIYSNIKYPKEDRDKNIEGTVIVQFVIGADGSISGIEIIRGPSEGLNNEAIRVMNAMAAMPEKWTPARDGGKAVAMKFTLPIKFKLQDEQQSNPIESKAPEVAVSNSTIKVIPNPAQESITVSIFKDTHTLKIFDTAGKLLITQKVTSNSTTSETMNISALKPGQYIVQVISDKESLSASFAVVK